MHNRRRLSTLPVQLIQLTEASDRKEAALNEFKLAERKYLQAHDAWWDIKRQHDRQLLEQAKNSKPLGEFRTFVFEQDHQGYSSSRHLFSTNAPLTADQMSKITWEQPGAGRLSAGFRLFLEQLQKMGFQVKDEHRILENGTGRGRAETQPYPSVWGATGNY